MLQYFSYFMVFTYLKLPLKLQVNWKKKNFIKPLNKFNSHSKGSINEFNYTQNLGITHMRPQFDAQLSSPN
jgi:hypothetical protein